MGYTFEVGKTYETQNGERVTVLGRNDELKGYESLKCSDNRCRYDRSTHWSDAGRCTGTDHDYSYPHNFKRPDITPGQQWVHKKGNVYEIEMLVNMDGDRHEEFPPSVVYRRLIDGTVWCRTIERWYGSFKLIGKD